MKNKLNIDDFSFIYKHSIEGFKVLDKDEALDAGYDYVSAINTNVFLNRLLNIKNDDDILAMINGIKTKG